MDERSRRREYLLTLGAVGAFGLAGCSGDSTTPTAQTEAPTSQLAGANFTFEYSPADRQVTIQFNGGADILAGDLQVRSTAGVQAEWAQLGSSVASPDERISTGATAILGTDILNWGQSVGPTETIRLVHVGQETPATLGRFTPPESSTLTATVPSTPTPEPTESPPAETPAPSISAFSLSNPSGQELRTAFESDQALATIQVSLSGAESVTLTTGDFAETVSGGTYTYETTYEASTDGEYTATLDTAADADGNDGASEQSVVLTLDSAASFQEDFDYPTAELTENGWNLEGGVSITDSRLTADARSNAYAATTLPSGFSGTWEFNGVQNNVEGRGFSIRFAVDLPEGDLDANVDEYVLAIQQLPDGIGNDYEGTNVGLWRSEDGEGTTLFDPEYDHDGEVHDYRIEVDQGQFRLFIDDEEFGEYTDQSDLYEDVTHINIRMDGVEQYVDSIRQER